MYKLRTVATVYKATLSVEYAGTLHTAIFNFLQYSTSILSYPVAKTQISLSLFAAFITSLVILSLFIFASFGFFVPYLVFIPGFWLPCVAPLVGFFISFIFTLAFNYSIEGKQRRFIKSAFSQYLSPTVIETLISEPNQLKLGGERREISIYFSDVQGFTTISEKLAETPEKLSEVLNKYLGGSL